MASNEEIVNLIRDESTRVVQYLIQLPRDAMELPTPCESWTIEDLIGHLVWFAETYGGMIEKGLRDDLTPPDGFPEAGAHGGVETEGLYARASINRRKDLGTGLLESLSERYAWLNDMLASIGPGDWEKLCYHTIRLRPVENFLPTIIQELVVHEWDIRSSVGSPTKISAESLPILIDKFPLGKPATNRRPWGIPFPTDSDSPKPLIYRFQLTGPGAVDLDLMVDGEQTRLEESTESLADLSCTGDTSSFVLMMYERNSLEYCLADGSFNADGDLDLVARFDRWLAIH